MAGIDMNGLEKVVLEFIKGDPKPMIIEIEEELEDESYDEVDGNVSHKNAKKRIESGWYGPQEPDRLRMDMELTSKELQSQAGCSERDLESVGLYKFTHIPTGESYVGKAQHQTLKKRVLQHLNKAMSDRILTGKIDPLLRDDPNMNNWKLKLEPMKQDLVGFAEELYIKSLQPSLNIQKPHKAL